jgi:hypothetical protein
MTISNKNARRYVENQREFKGSHAFAEVEGTQESGYVYKVYSYGYHFPLFVFKNNQWYFNKDKYSATTSIHKSQLMPIVENHIDLSTEELKAL